MSEHSATPVSVVLSGYGPVGRAYVEHLAAHGEALADRHGARLRLAAVRTGSAEYLPPPAEGTDAEGTGDTWAPPPPRSAWGPLPSPAETLDRTGAGVLVQCLPSSPEVRDQAAAEALLALRRGVHVVTATKSHLLSHWRELGRAAAEGGSLIRISGATGAALPAGDLARAGVRGLGCRTIRACPNGTATFVLDRLAAGDSLADAVAEARRRGIAEADPSADLSGSDAATKARLLAALLWGWDASAVRTETEPVDDGTARAAREAAASGHRLRAVAGASADEPLLVRVRLERTAPGDPLHALTGPEKAVVYGCPDAGDITVSGGRSSPLGAALAMVKDTLDVAVPRRLGFG
ncbi:homoserine dehydrogenase [Streptomyces sp. NBS 14/10]|uniref:homoserine dehydrogenase n=1 Tax=Streptomyces sp. NBS 14/10 TaxID=1945643 RepID=UPI0015C5A965|nr:homoserine dehydrogenase [Streptomyces sp. NBS 14/10]KAK1181267.1 homoserine dehydrogenase [Streptomyces sp. NBS 14/10]